jgi:hypothetical protein
MSIPTVVRIRAARFAPLALVSVLAGCGDEFLMVNYLVVPQNTQFVADVRSGTRSLSDAFSGGACVLTVDPSVVPLTSRQAGTIGQAGYSVRIAAVNPVNAVTSNPATCPSIEELVLQIGAQGEVLGIGGTTGRTDLTARVDGVAFDSGRGGLFEATITGQSQARGTVSGGFEAIAPAPGSNPPVMIVTEGSFNVR